MAEAGNQHTHTQAYREREKEREAEREEVEQKNIANFFERFVGRAEMTNEQIET